MKKFYSKATLTVVLMLTTVFFNVQAQFTWLNGPSASTINCLLASGTSLFAGTQGNGLFATTNNGTTWTPVSGGLVGSNVNSLVTLGSNIFAATSGGLYKSTNNGSTWATSSTGIGSGTIDKLVVSGTNLFAVASDQVFRSTNSGASWTMVYNAFPVSNPILSIAAKGSTVIIGSGSNYVYVSTDNGSNWTLSNTVLPNTSFITVYITNSTMLAVGSFTGEYISYDNGFSWGAVNTSAPLDIYSITEIGSTLYAGTQGAGVYYSNDAGNNWYSINNTGISNLQVYSLTTSGNTLYAGTGSNGVFMSTNPNCNLTATIAPAGPTTVCSGNVVLNATTGTGLSYKWKNNGVVITGATGASYTATVSGYYSVDITATGGCASSSPGVIVTIGGAPAAIITPTGPTTVCSGNVVLNANTGAGLSYQWKNNGTNITGATAASYTANTSGSYTVVVTASGSCSTTSGAISVVIGSNPTATITPAGSTTVCSGSVLLNANTGTGLTYQWKNNGTNISGATAASYSATTSGSYTVVVTATGGCSATSAATVVNIGAAPTATITPAGSTTICSGSVVLNANTGTGLTYQWKNNGTNISGATAANYTAITSGSYTVVVTATGGCSATSAATVVSIGSLTAAVTPSGTITICSGTSTTLSATAGTGYTYKWYRNNVLLSTTTQTFTTGTGGTYKCMVTSGSCTATTNSVVLNVPVTPTATVSYSTPLSFCSPGSVTFTANTLSGATYQWENNSIVIPGATAQTYVATTAGAYRVKETKSGCSDYSSVKTVTAATSVAAAISTTDATTQCTGGTVNMSITSPIPGYSYQWKKNLVNITGATANTYAATSTGSYTVTATASCGTGNSNAIAVTIGTLTAQITPATSATLCTGGSLILSANTGSGYAYQWKNNNLNITGATASTYTVTTAGSYTVAITSPCGNATSSATVVTQAAPVTASITPAGTSTVCSGTSQTFTANAGPGYTYKWYRNNVLLTSTGQTFTTATAGSYKVEVSISGSCAVQSNTATLTVIVITPTITAGGPTTFCAGQSVTFTANALSGATYQWQKSSVNIAGATAQTYTATTAGSYRVQETKSICSKYSSAKTVTVNCRLGTNGEEINDDETSNTITMEVYPNPFADELNVNITSPTTEQAEIRIMDVLGKVQYSQMITTNAAIELNTQLPAGVYMITTNIDGQVRTQRVVKTK